MTWPWLFSPTTFFFFLPRDLALQKESRPRNASHGVVIAALKKRHVIPFLVKSTTTISTKPKNHITDHVRQERPVLSSARRRQRRRPPAQQPASTIHSVNGPVFALYRASPDPIRLVLGLCATDFRPITGPLVSLPASELPSEPTTPDAPQLPSSLQARYHKASTATALCPAYQRRAFTTDGACSSSFQD